MPLECHSVWGMMKSARSASEVKATPAATQRAQMLMSALLETEASSFERKAEKFFRIFGSPLRGLFSEVIMEKFKEFQQKDIALLFVCQYYYTFLLIQE